MRTSRQLLAALLCGLLVGGCNDVRSDAVTVHVHLDAALAAALPQPMPGDGDAYRQAGVAVGLRPRPPVPVAHRGSDPADAGRASASLGSLGRIDLGGGKDAGLVLVAVVAVVLVAVVAWRIGTAVTAPHAAVPPATYALALGGGPEPAQLLQLRDGHALRLPPALVDALAHGGYRRATLQPSGSAVALPVQVVLDGPLLCVRPQGAFPSR